jgi:hypothetical protein
VRDVRARLAWDQIGANMRALLGERHAARRATPATTVPLRPAGRPAGAAGRSGTGYSPTEPVGLEATLNGTGTHRDAAGV